MQKDDAAALLGNFLEECVPALGSGRESRSIHERRPRIKLPLETRPVRGLIGIVLRSATDVPVYGTYVFVHGRRLESIEHRRVVRTERRPEKKLSAAYVGSNDVVGFGELLDESKSPGGEYGRDEVAMGNRVIGDDVAIGCKLRQKCGNSRNDREPVGIRQRSGREVTTVQKERGVNAFGAEVRRKLARPWAWSVVERQHDRLRWEPHSVEVGSRKVLRDLSCRRFQRASVHVARGKDCPKCEEAHGDEARLRSGHDRSNVAAISRCAARRTLCAPAQTGHAPEQHTRRDPARLDTLERQT